MTKETCVKCYKETRAVIDTEDGPVCFSCFDEIRNPTKSKRKVSHEEADIQAEFFDKFKLFFPKVPDRLIFHVPNGGSRHKVEARNMKRQGVKPGVSDVILLIPKKGYASLLLEFKTQTGKQSDDQKKFQQQAESCGSKYVIVRSASAAIDEVEKYLK